MSQDIIRWHKMKRIQWEKRSISCDAIFIDNQFASVLLTNEKLQHQETGCLYSVQRTFTFQNMLLDK
jgi:hypothetical protein